MDDETDLSLPADIYNFKECTSIFSMISTLNIASMTSTTFQKCISNFQRFLSTFPWLYVYWDKYATFVWSGKGDLDLVRTIYFEALSKKCLFYSVDMWICCIKFFRTNLTQTEQDEMRNILALSLDAVGSHYNSAELWRLAINFESENHRSVFPLLAKSITYPTSELKHFWAELQLLFPKVSLQYFQAFIDNKDKSVTELLQLFLTIPINAIQIATSIDMSSTENENFEEIQLRSNYISILTDFYNSSLEKVSKRAPFEENITRTFFHFNSPDDYQIFNWEQYIQLLQQDYFSSKTRENFNDVIMTYERALIPCAFIDSLWLDYANFLEDNISTDFVIVDDVRNVYLRIPFEILPSAKIVYAEFEEVHSPTENAPIVYDQLAKSNNAEQIIAAASYHLRLNTPESAETVATILHEARDRLFEAKDLEGTSLIATFMIDVLKEPTENIIGATYVSKYAHLFSQTNPEEVNTFLFNAIFASEATIEDQISLLQIYLEYMRKHGSPAKFQLELEAKYTRLKNKIIWHDNYFKQNFLLRNRGPETKLEDWFNYEKEIK